MIDKLITFLETHPGYLKEGAERLSKRLKKQKMFYSVSDCRKALDFVRKNKRLKKLDKAKILIYDIETSYNIVSAWRVGYNLNLPHYSILKERAIICVSYKWVGEDQVYNLTWDKNQDDKFLLQQFVEVMNEADILIAHNGDKFDLKWIRTRALKHGIEMLPSYNQHDTLQMAKRLFYLNSNKLDYIAKFLGFEGKINTSPELWDKVILEKDINALKEMVTYCNEDVLQLEKIYLKLKNYDKPRFHVGVQNDAPKYSSPYTGAQNIKLVKTTTTAKGTIKRIMQDLDTGGYFEMSDVNYKNYLKSKNEN